MLELLRGFKAFSQAVEAKIYDRLACCTTDCCYESRV